MSVLIKGIEMPTRCWDCLLNTYGYCMASEHSDIIPSDAPIPDWCPLVPVPPHGDLIDRDALMADAEPVKDWTGVTKNVVWEKQINRAPVIIPAEEADHA